MMKNIGLGVFVVSVTVGWTAPSFAAEAAGRPAASIETASAEAIRVGGENICRSCIPGEGIPAGEAISEFLDSRDVPCCEDDAESMECLDWQCVAGIAGGTLGGALAGAGSGAAAGAPFAGIGAGPGAVAGGIVGAVAGGLLAYGTIPSCASPPPAPPSSDWVPDPVSPVYDYDPEPVCPVWDPEPVCPVWDPGSGLDGCP